MYFAVRATMAASVSASASFTTAIDFLNFDNGSIQVVWSGFDQATGTIRLRGSIIDASTYDSLTVNPQTLVATAGNQVYNITDIGYEKVQVVYAANTVSTGTVDIYCTRKSRR